MVAAAEDKIRPERRYPCGHWWWLDKATGEMRAFECHSWSCIVCRSWRRAHWIHRLQSALPERHIVLTRLADDPKQIWRYLAHLSQSIRRTGRAWQYFATSEKTISGIPHLHLLAKGDHLPQRLLSEISVAHGAGRIVWIRSIPADDEDARIIGLYVTRHLLRAEPHGHAHPTPRRIRYSRRFFPPKPELEAEAEAEAAVALEKATRPPTTWSLIKPYEDQPGWAALEGDGAAPPFVPPAYRSRLQILGGDP